MSQEAIPMLLWCPECGSRHIDEGELATKPHHTHACQHCGHVWRPSVGATVGVQFLPGFKNDEAPKKSDIDASQGLPTAREAIIAALLDEIILRHGKEHGADEKAPEHPIDQAVREAYARSVEQHATQAVLTRAICEEIAAGRKPSKSKDFVADADVKQMQQTQAIAEAGGLPPEHPIGQAVREAYARSAEQMAAQVASGKRTEDAARGNAIVAQLTRERDEYKEQAEQLRGALHFATSRLAKMEDERDEARARVEALEEQMHGLRVSFGYDIRLMAESRDSAQADRKRYKAALERIAAHKQIADWNAIGIAREALVQPDPVAGEDLRSGAPVVLKDGKWVNAKGEGT